MILSTKLKVLYTPIIFYSRLHKLASLSDGLPTTLGNGVFRKEIWVECRYNAVLYKHDIAHIIAGTMVVYGSVAESIKDNLYPALTRYVMSFVNIVEKIERVITAPHSGTTRFIRIQVKSSCSHHALAWFWSCILHELRNCWIIPVSGRVISDPGLAHSFPRGRRFRKWIGVKYVSLLPYSLDNCWTGLNIIRTRWMG